MFTLRLVHPSYTGRHLLLEKNSRFVFIERQRMKKKKAQCLVGIDHKPQKGCNLTLAFSIIKVTIEEI